MKLRLITTRLNGTRVALIVDVDADGSIQYWRSEDPESGAHVALSSSDKWLAVSRMHTEIAKMTRGAA